MLGLSLAEMGVIALSAILGTGWLTAIMTRCSQPTHSSRHDARLPAAAGPVFLIKDKTIIDATPEAALLISEHTRQMSEYDAVMYVLSPHFRNLREHLANPDDTKQRIEGKLKDGVFLEITRQDDLVRLAIRGKKAGTSIYDVLNQDVRLSELDMLRDLTKHSPQLIWHEDFSGKLLWANQTYLSFCDRLKSHIPNSTSTWPSTPIFPEIIDAPPQKQRSVRRLSVPLPDKKAEHWFDVTSVKRDDGFIHFAADANAIVRADQDRRNFVQTLSKTFAQLEIGLAIFDKRRQLATFNPALLELTNLPIEFLSSRPTVDAVLDRLREARMLPEPADYKTWREEFMAVESAARAGKYCENWNLMDGQTYRVTGHPHPDGAFALMMEDISAAISMTQRFRTDIETSQAVLDTLPDAIAVFSSSGNLIMSNEAYSDLWGHVERGSVHQAELAQEIQTWQSRCTPTQMWSELRTYINKLGTRKKWSDSAILDDGRLLQCDADPVTGGMTLVRFTFAQPVKPVIRKLMLPDNALLAAKR